MCGCAEWLESRTCDQQVGGSNPDRCTAECNPGQVVYMRTPLLLSSTIWYPLAGEVTWQNVMAVYCQVYGFGHLQDQDRLQNSMLNSSLGLPYLYPIQLYCNTIL